MGGIDNVVASLEKIIAKAKLDPKIGKVVFAQLTGQKLDHVLLYAISAKEPALYGPIDTKIWREYFDNLAQKDGIEHNFPYKKDSIYERSRYIFSVEVPYATRHVKDAAKVLSKLLTEFDKKVQQVNDIVDEEMMRRAESLGLHKLD